MSKFNTSEQLTRLLGKPFADSLDAPFVVYFNEQWSRRQVVEWLHVGNFVAARRLETLLERLRITTPLKLANTDPFSLYRTAGVGVTQLYVAMALLEHHGHNPVTWWDNFTETSRARRRKQVA